MIYKTISSGFAAGYTLNMAKYTGLRVTGSGSIGGAGTDIGSDTVGGTLNNYGTLTATARNAAVYIGFGMVTNHATISGYYGVRTHFNGTVSTWIQNSGLISGEEAVQLFTPGTVGNYGTIAGISEGVDIEYGFILRNGIDAVITGRIGVETHHQTGNFYNHGRVTGSAYGVLFGPGTLFNGSDQYANALITSNDIAVTSYGATLMNYGGFISNGGLAVKAYGGVVDNAGAFAIISGVEGVETFQNATVINNGVIEGQPSNSFGYGLYMFNGGTVTNGSSVDVNAEILGTEGVSIRTGVGSVANFGTILADGHVSKHAVSLQQGGVVTNGSSADRAASISGAYGVAFGAVGTLSNYGQIVGVGEGAVLLKAGGTVHNGRGVDTTAQIVGAYGVHAYGAAAIYNYGSIISQDASDAGVEIGTVTGVAKVFNGTASDLGALITGLTGVSIGGAGTVNNYATILGAEVDGVDAGGGSAVNGSGGDVAALVKGLEFGVNESAVATVANYGTIQGLTIAGVYLGQGGLVVNGGGSDHAALIEGRIGLQLGTAGTVRNFGSIEATGGVASYAAVMLAGGVFQNGSATNASALVSGYGGLNLNGVSGQNFGTVMGLGDAGGAGLKLAAASAFINGSAGHAAALIEGYVGVTTAGASTFTNFGTVVGEGGVAVTLTSASDTLVVEPNSAFVGAVYGGGGTLELGGGVGTITGLLTSSATIAGSMAPTQFHAFSSAKIDSGASFTLNGGASVIAGQTFAVNGTASTSGTLKIAGGVLNVGGTLAGTGVLSLTSGMANFNAGASLTVAKANESGASAVASFNVASLTVGDVWTQTAGTISAAAGDRVNFTGVGDTFSGTLSGAGTIAFTGGTDLISSAHLTATTQIVNGATVTLFGTIAETGSMSATALTIAVAGASLTGGGMISLTNLASSFITGASAASILFNGDKITGAGQLGDGVMTLANQVGGSVIANVSNGLTIDTGAATVSNAGLIENTGTGGLLIKSAVNNTGTLMVTTGTLQALGAVSGAGIVKIAGGTADFAAAFGENVTFTSTTGVLELAKSQSYAGAITGFSKTGTTSLDLVDITFGGTTTAKFSGTTASGVLTVTDGTHTAKIALLGNYTASTFSVSSDGHGGTSVIDPTPQAPKPHFPLISALAAFGGGGGTAAFTAYPATGPAPMLTRPALA